jgi:hypothetical protein
MITNLLFASLLSSPLTRGDRLERLVSAFSVVFPLDTKLSEFDPIFEKSNPDDLPPSEPPTYPPLPPKEAGKSSLVVVTHGWWPFAIGDVSIWVSAMVDSIATRVPNNWQVMPYIWEGATAILPTRALINGWNEGVA